MAETPSRRCEFCGTPNDADAVFCGACGRAIAGPTAGPVRLPPRREPDPVGSKTMLGLPGTALPGLGGPSPAPPASPASPASGAPAPGGQAAPGQPPPAASPRPPVVRTAGSSKDPSRTVLGLPAPVLGPADGAPPGPAGGAPPGSVASPAPGPAAPLHLGGPTMIDGPRLDLEAIMKAHEAQGGEEPTRASAPRVSGHGTMLLGAPQPAAPAPGAAPWGGSPPAPAASPGGPAPGPERPSGGPPPSRPRADAGMTMLGVPIAAPQAGGSSPPGPSGAAAPSRPAGPFPQDSGMTMLGVPAPARPSAPAPGAPPVSGAAFPGASPETEPVDEPAPRRKGRGGLVIVLVVLLLAVGVLGGLTAALVLGRRGPTLVPEVAAAGEVLRVTIGVDPPPEGGRVRFAGQEAPVVSGRASFEIPADTIRVGDNDLAVEVVDGSGDVTEHRIGVHLSHRAVADLSGLSGSPPSYVVRFQVAPGATLSVSGRPVQLDASHGYLHRVLLSDALAGAVDAGDAVVHRVPYAVRPADGPAVNGSVDTSIPRTRLRLDRPAEGAAVDRDGVFVVGATEPGAAVTVAGQPAETDAGRFVARAPLAASPEEQAIEVTAAAPGKAPRTARVTVRRVESLAPFVEAFAATVDQGLTYQALAADPAAVRGRPLRLAGRVVAIETVRGQTLMQLLVEAGCPAGEHCFLYVAYGGETDAAVGASVEVYGEAAGVRELPTQGGGRLTMPAVDARFVVADRSR